MTPDENLQDYRQGDCFIGDRTFIQRAHVDDAEEDWLEESVLGLILTSQTCDVVRRIDDRPSVTMSPLVQVDEDQYAQALKRLQPRFAVVPGHADQRLVADLDRSVTVDKALMVRWARSRGVRDDVEARAFAGALARKAARFAFPDDFNEYVAPLARRLAEKHNKQSEEGAALRSLAEVRIMAEPNWDAAEVELTFYFIRARDADSGFNGISWDDWAGRWVALLQDAARYKAPHAVVLDYPTMTAAEYLQTDQLDLERLSH